MQKFIETTGKTEDAAIAAALEQLGLSREEVSVEVLDLAKPGFLGIGGTPARVKVTYEAPDEPEEVRVPIVEEAPAGEKADEEADSVEYTTMGAAFAENVESAAPAPADDGKAAKIKEFLTGLLERMEVEAVPQVSVDAEGNYLVELVGENLGAVIGRRGETLDAIQQLTSYSVNRGQTKRVRIHLDAEGYRAKREESLTRLARKVAGKVVKYRKNVTLEAMNAYERHVIHTALQDYPDVTTYSVGTEPNRHTVVAYSRGEHR